MSTTHEDHHFSATYWTDDLAVVYCLRAISQFSQKTGNARIPWGGTKKEDWIRDGCKVTFRFSQQSYRDTFVEEVSRLLPSVHYKLTGQSDADPATPVPK